MLADHSKMLDHVPPRSATDDPPKKEEDPITAGVREFFESLQKFKDCMPKPDPCALPDAIKAAHTDEFLCQMARLQLEFHQKMTAMSSHYQTSILDSLCGKAPCAPLRQTVRLTGAYGIARACFSVHNPGKHSVDLAFYKSSFRGGGEPPFTFDVAIDSPKILGPGATADVRITIDLKEFRRGTFEMDLAVQEPPLMEIRLEVAALTPVETTHLDTPSDTK
ncbi:MAG: hypothetical protein EXR72_07565 [Myxococcales bacterium]|nr:hypothetical protein [Myxococcales bacterium]